MLVCFHCLFLMILRTPRSTLFPYTSLFRSQVVGQLLDVGGAAPRVDDPRRPGLLLQQQLGVAGDPRGEVGGQRERRSEEHTSELKSRQYIVGRLLLEKKKMHTSKIKPHSYL